MPQICAEYFYANRNRSRAAATKKATKQEFAANRFCLCCYTEQASGEYESVGQEKFLTYRFPTYAAAEAQAKKWLTDCEYDVETATWFRKDAFYIILEK